MNGGASGGENGGMDDEMNGGANEAKYIHSEELKEKWGKYPITYQMGNIGSEVSRSLKWTGKNEERAQKAIDRALELFEFTIDANVRNHARLREILMAREEFLDYFFNSNSYRTEPERMQKYYDEFVVMGQRSGVVHE